MDVFYTTVLSVAIVVLILMLTYIGIRLSYSKTKEAPYPPVSGACPDYWTSSIDSSGCVVSEKNKGKLDSNALSKTAGYNSKTNTIDFKDPKWALNGTAVCNQRDWSMKNGVVWDGVSNYNSCVTTKTSSS
jgi:hypothetical protein